MSPDAALCCDVKGFRREHPGVAVWDDQPAFCSDDGMGSRRQSTKRVRVPAGRRRIPGEPLLRTGSTSIGIEPATPADESVLADLLQRNLPTICCVLKATPGPAQFTELLYRFTSPPPYTAGLGRCRSSLTNGSSPMSSAAISVGRRPPWLSERG